MHTILIKTYIKLNNKELLRVVISNVHKRVQLHGPTKENKTCKQGFSISDQLQVLAHHDLSFLLETYIMQLSISFSTREKQDIYAPTSPTLVLSKLKDHTKRSFAVNSLEQPI